MAERSSERGAPVCSSWDVATSGDTICWYDDTNWHQLIVGVGHQLTWKFDRAKREELDRAQARVDLASEALREALNIGAVTKCDYYAADKVLDAREAEIAEERAWSVGDATPALVAYGALMTHGGHKRY